MTPRERLLTAMRGGRPDRVPMPLRMWKFLRKHYKHIPDPTQRELAAHEEFGTDIFHYAAQPPFPCFSPLGTPWRDDVEVQLTRHDKPGRKVWERTVRTPGGTFTTSSRRWSSAKAQAAARRSSSRWSRTCPKTSRSTATCTPPPTA